MTEIEQAASHVIPQGAHEIVRYVQNQAEQVNMVLIEDRSQFQLEGQRLRDVVTAKRNLEEMRLSATGPLNQALQAINGWFRGPREQAERIERVLKVALGDFEAKERRRIAEEERQARAKAEEERAELERRAQAAAARGRTERAQELQAKAVAVVPEAPQTAPVKARGMGFGTEWVYEIEDESKVPMEYRSIDHAKIRGVVQALKEKAAIAGIKIWSRPRVSAQGNRR